MFKKISIIIISVFVISFVSTLCFAEEKVAVVDLQKIFSEYKQTDQFQEELDALQEKLNEEIEKYRQKGMDELEKLRNKLEVAKEDKKDELQKKIDSRTTEINEFIVEKRLELRQRMDEMRRELVEHIQNAVEKYSKKRGFTLVFKEPALVYFNDALDITDQVLEQLNK